MPSKVNYVELFKNKHKLQDRDIAVYLENIYSLKDLTLLTTRISYLIKSGEINIYQINQLQILRTFLNNVLSEQTDPPPMF